MDFDWVTGNLYASTREGNTFVCDTTAVPTSLCVNIISNQGDVEGMVLSLDQR